MLGLCTHSCSRCGIAQQLALVVLCGCLAHCAHTGAQTTVSRQRSAALLSHVKSSLQLQGVMFLFVHPLLNMADLWHVMSQTWFIFGWVPDIAIVKSNWTCFLLCTDPCAQPGG